MVFSSDPSNITRKDKFDKEEIKRAIRNDLMAELDAINFYLQQSRFIEDQKLRSSHEDIANEEITHFGEFLRMLYEVAPEEFQYIKKGWEEASKILGTAPKIELGTDIVQENKTDDPSTPEDEVIKWIKEGLGNRIIRNLGNIVSYNYETVSVSEVSIEQGDIVQGRFKHTYEIPYLSMQVKLGFVNMTDRRNIAVQAGLKFALTEDKLLIKDHPLSPVQYGLKLKASDWNVPGNILSDVVKAYTTMRSEGYGIEVYILMPPSIYPLTFRVVDRSGTLEIEEINKIGKVFVVPALEKEIVVISKPGLDILVNMDTKVEYLTKEKDYDIYLISERIAPRLMDPHVAITTT